MSKTKSNNVIHAVFGGKLPHYKKQAEENVFECVINLASTKLPFFDPDDVPECAQSFNPELNPHGFGTVDDETA